MESLLIVLIHGTSASTHMSISQEHTIVTIDQFTKQAIPFAQIPGHSSALDVLVDLAQPNVHDYVLDVACGPGLVACHFAIRVRSVTGIDVTPAMISEALKRSSEQGIENIKWQIGSATSLQLGDDLFDLVISRYAFHHLQDPLLGMKEMIRVCKPGGRVLVADVALPADKVDAYDKLELIRDPSHTHALSRHEFAELFQNEEFNQVWLCRNIKSISNSKSRSTLHSRWKVEPKRFAKSLAGTSMLIDSELMHAKKVARFTTLSQFA